MRRGASLHRLIVVSSIHLTCTKTTKTIVVHDMHRIIKLVRHKSRFPSHKMTRCCAHAVCKQSFTLSFFGCEAALGCYRLDYKKIACIAKSVG